MIAILISNRLFCDQIQMYTAEKSKEYEWRKKIENDEIKTGSQGGDSRREKDETDRNFLKQIEQTAISSSTLHGRIAARKVTIIATHFILPHCFLSLI